MSLLPNQTFVQVNQLGMSSPSTIAAFCTYITIDCSGAQLSSGEVVVPVSYGDTSVTITLKVIAYMITYTGQLNLNVTVLL